MSAKWLRFEIAGAPNRTKKTKAWAVFEKNRLPPAARLGTIKWHAQWRGYAFFPADNCVFEHRCLRDLAEFIERENFEHTTARRTPPESSEVLRDAQQADAD